MDKELYNLMKRFEKDKYLIVKDGYLTRQLVKKPKIKKMRKNGNLIIAPDRRKKLTIFFKIPKI